MWNCAPTAGELERWLSEMREDQLILLVVLLGMLNLLVIFIGSAIVDSLEKIERKLKP
jgi:hypothetical protein